MASPFPGMDPYLEAHWGDVHSALVIYSRDAVQARLPRDLRARVEERVYVDRHPAPERTVVPDVRVIERATTPPDIGGGGTAVLQVTIDEPLVFTVEQEEAVTETFIEIRESGGSGRLITVIEVLSPANKRPGPGRSLYLRKQAELLQGGVNLVEIDLLRGGERVQQFKEDNIPQEHRTPYVVTVRRGIDPLQVEWYRAPLRSRLPVIGVPLRETDPDVPLNLQALIAQCYQGGAYDDIDYRQEPDPPLNEEDTKWAAALLKETKRR